MLACRRCALKRRYTSSHFFGQKINTRREHRWRCSRLLCDSDFDSHYAVVREEYVFVVTGHKLRAKISAVIRKTVPDRPLERRRHIERKKCIDYHTLELRFLYKGIIINHNKKPSQPTLKRRFFKKKAAFFHGPVWERSGADFILKRKGEFF